MKIWMPQQQSDDRESEEENLDDEHLWEDMNSVKESELLSLQLAMNDGMKEVKAISRSIAKTSRFSTLSHSCSQFKDKFEAAFHSTKTIPAANKSLEQHFQISGGL